MDSWQADYLRDYVLAAVQRRPRVLASCKPAPALTIAGGAGARVHNQENEKDYLGLCVPQYLPPAIPAQ